MLKKITYLRWILLFCAALLVTSLSQAADIQAFSGKLKDPITKLPDFSTYTVVSEKKTAFFATLLPLVNYENQRLVWQKQQLQLAQELAKQSQQLSKKEASIINSILEEYSFTWPLSDKDWHSLAMQVEQVPADLVLVQAANESAWGTSRFARQGNNLFGQWCFTQGCGLVPNQRNAGAVHEVRKFANIYGSVKSYMNNINTHKAYTDLRQLRYNKLQNQKQVQGLDLTAGLLKYSERGQAYVNELNSMLRTNAKLIQHSQQNLAN